MSIVGRGTWNVNTLVGSTWTYNNVIYRPNADLEYIYNGTVRQIDLATGARALVVPEVPLVYDPIMFTWTWIAYGDSFVTTIQNYIANGTYIQIVDHLGNSMTGVFSEMHRVWLLDTEGTYYDYKATFLRTG